MPRQRVSTAAGLLLGLSAAMAPSMVAAAPTCLFLTPIGGNGTTPIVSKQVGRGTLIGRTNWNTDFIVDRPYRSYKFFFTANSSDPSARYPVSGYMKFSDGSNLEVFNELISPPIGTGKEYGPFPAVAGKQASQMNFKIGASSDPGALGFSYRISVQGCL
jgi:hypothetical protein